MFARLFVYQRERFPLLSHGALIAIFSASAIAFSAWTRHAAFPSWPILAAGFASSLIFFAQLRIADEWKDAEEDARYRPYRPVPRGLVTLRELAIVGIAGAIVQLAIAAAVSPQSIGLLLLGWAFFALMAREFFIGSWLRRHPIAYMLSHMAIMPIIDLYVSSFDWLRSGAAPSHALVLFLAVTFCNGMVLEIGRKIRAPRDEEPGVETYSALWGRARASQAWLASLAATGCVAILTAYAGRENFAMLVAATIGLIAAVFTAAFFILHPTRGAARLFEAVSGTWTVALYACLGLAPFAGSVLR